MTHWQILVPAGIIVLAWLIVRGWRDDNGLRRLMPLISAGCWVGYWLWETRVIDPGDNIRVDLLLIYPALAAQSFLGVVALLAWVFRGPEDQSQEAPEL